MDRTVCGQCGSHIGDDPMSRGHIVQIAPSVDMFGGALAVIDEIHQWGVMAYLAVPGEENNQIAWLRLSWEQFELTGGIVAWVISEKESSDG